MTQIYGLRRLITDHRLHRFKDCADKLRSIDDTPACGPVAKGFGRRRPIGRDLGSQMTQIWGLRRLFTDPG